jgi:hypothetical protein
LNTILGNPAEECGGKLSPLTHRFAALGAHGKFPNNIERDLATLLQLPVSPIWITIPVRSPTNRETLETMKVPVLLPHEIYNYLYEPRLYVEMLLI